MTELYAGYNKDTDIRNKSSSGGIYYLFAWEVIRNDGVVFAACYNGLKVKHMKIDNNEMLINSLGSKYIPSELDDTYDAVKKEIENGKYVLFAGLPCQCAGLLSFINTTVDKTYRDKLLLVDLVCHGIPGIKAWEGYCDSLKNEGFDLSKINMRDKSTGWKNYSLSLTDTNDEKRVEPHNNNTYINGFISNLYLRPACNNCKFKGVERETDITLGDYWGVQNIQPQIDDDKGISLIFIHSEKGKELFKEIVGEIISIQVPIDEAIKYNSSIVSSSVQSDKRDEFYKRLMEGEDFNQIVEEMDKKPFAIRVKRGIKNIVKNIMGGGR